MNRRAFLASLAAALALDPERALWVPGKKLISIPPPGRWCVRYLSEWDPIWLAMVQRVDAMYGMELPHGFSATTSVIVSDPDLRRAMQQLTASLPSADIPAESLVEAARELPRGHMLSYQPLPLVHV
jgi:hypothetical protein